ncbi:LLM class F420-dependent oxidoreductase [Hoyosella rhizosphaerae]|uniref:LLM class F420-dependent oxidoreductase n=1 Tax=Hoyosella rhizosphaerae TaxID=1755582 RepID=A0A916XBF4_9ACTN|nr:LLM class F420-dependent oxidoreductase [Hoyosella rhizosphaerae]MBN4926548.1 LLM class F420-dependent oxidoreductase [Hoyosella rhizosphaerae]GGC58388.1 LLM class F420-dependent oxidoreductase [Hoyosella rhizosphaerae]
MKLSLNAGYWGLGNDGDNLAVAIEADKLGFSSVWVAEAYGSDAATVMAWIAAHTKNIDIGSAVMQIPARTPALTAMTAATLDTMSGHRFRLGLGVSGPQVSEGWHGVRFGQPLARTREYVDIVRMALRREKLRYDGKHYTLPLPDGPGKSIQLTVQGARADIPIYLAAIGPKNLELTGEIADGWLGMFVAPRTLPEQLAAVSAGRSKANKTLDGFDVAPTLPLVPGDDWRAAADATRMFTALYVGGMGSRDKNFYNSNAARMGYADAAAEVQDLFLARKYQEAQAALPAEFLDEVGLLGSADRIAEKMRAYAEAGVTNLVISVMPGTDPFNVLRTAAEAYEKSGVAE